MNLNEAVHQRLAIPSIFLFLLEQSLCNTIFNKNWLFFQIVGITTVMHTE